MSPTAPKVFISHASLDKERFVEPFAERLRANGVDAWLDKWELKLGDDLPRQIFEHGIGETQAVIVVLSPVYIGRQWPQEELSASVVQRLERKLKIIPVMIEECKIPVSIGHLFRVSIKDLQSYDMGFEQILRAIFDSSAKPLVGAPPKYVQRPSGKIPGLELVDSSLFARICETSLEKQDTWLSGDVVQDIVDELEVPTATASDSVDVLADRLLVDTVFEHPSTMPGVKIRARGFDLYGRYFVQDFEDLVQSCLLAIVNHGITTQFRLADHLSASKTLVEYFLNILVARRLIKLDRVLWTPEGIAVSEVTAQGRRTAMDG